MTTNNDLSRDIGRMEGEFAAVKDSVTRLEGVVSEGLRGLREEMANMRKDVRVETADLVAELAALKAKEHERTGAMRVIVGISGLVSASVAASVAVAVKYLLS